MFASLAPSLLSRLGRGFALKHLHATLFIAADHQVLLGVGLERAHVKLANGLGFSLKVPSSWLFNQYSLLRGLRSTSSRIRQMLERPMASVPGVSSKAVTISSKVQRVTLRSWSWGKVLTTEITYTRVGEAMVLGRPGRGASWRPAKPWAW